jgi:hypothetical protein
MKSFTHKLLKLTFLFSIFFAVFSAQAQAPQKMSYQAVVRNAANALITNTAVGVKISVIQTTANGTVVYSESHAPTTNANGLATFEIGGGTVLSGTFSTINWSNGPYFIKTETDPTGGTNYTISGTSQLASVPYALFAANGGTPGPQGIQGIAGATGATGTNGKNTLILTTTEPPGANCATGGTKQQYGLDTSDNGALEPSEINASLTKYICNGLAGTAANAWGLTGTAGTTAANFIGTTDNKPVVIKTNNTQAMNIDPNGSVTISSGIPGPLVTKLYVEGDSYVYGNSLQNLNNYGGFTVSNPSLDVQGEINSLTFDGKTIQSKGSDDQGAFVGDLKINPLGGNIGVGNTGVLQNKLQIGNPPGFSGNDIAIGNGTQAMSLAQSTTASTFFTNTNFAFMPAGGVGNVGINTTTPSSKLEVQGSQAAAFNLVTTDYTATDSDYVIYANKQFDDTTPLTITLPLPASCPGRIYVIKAVALPELYNSNNLSMSYDVDGLWSDPSYLAAIASYNGAVVINNHLNEPITFLHLVLTSSGSLFYYQSRTSIRVQSIGLRWIIIDSDFDSDRA